MNLNEAWSAVADFHRIFQHPQAQTPTLLTVQRGTTRMSWIQEEIEEFIVSEDIPDQVDALADTLYFVLGTLVEMGVPPLKVFMRTFYPTIPEEDIGIDDLCQRERSGQVSDPFFIPIQRVQLIASSMKEEVDMFAHAEDIANQTRIMVNLIYMALKAFSETGVLPQKIFEVVHNANMNKLWPDGELHLREDGKVIKPLGWKDPKMVIREILEQRIPV